VAVVVVEDHHQRPPIQPSQTGFADARGVCHGGEEKAPAPKAFAKSKSYFLGDVRSLQLCGSRGCGVDDCAGSAVGHAELLSRIILQISSHVTGRLTSRTRFLSFAGGFRTSRRWLAKVEIWRARQEEGSREGRQDGAVCHASLGHHWGWRGGGGQRNLLHSQVRQVNLHHACARPPPANGAGCPGTCGSLHQRQAVFA
jgi:hypothetical protein